MRDFIRKEAVIIDETRSEIGRILDTPLKKCACIAVVKNIYAGKQVQEMPEYAEYGKELGKRLIENALDALQITADDVNRYGKAVVTGFGGEQEHGSALLHTGFDEGVRSVLTTSKSIIPSSEKSAPAGCTVDVPLHHKLALKVRTHFDAMEVSVADAPREDEILIALCVTTGGRPFPRVGGLLLKDIKGENGVI